MSIKPLDIRNKEFGRSFRGYDTAQVEDFLETVADEFERIYTENIKINEEISSVRERLEQFEELESSIREALVQAEKAAEDVRESAKREAESLRLNANREAELIVREARTKASQMLSDASARIEQARSSYEALKAAKERFASDFRELLSGYLRVMEGAEVASAREIEASLRERLDLHAVHALQEEEPPDEEARPAEEETQVLEGREEGDPPQAGEEEEAASGRG